MRVFDIDTARAEAFAAAHSTSDCATTSAASIRAPVAEVDICISCTTSKSQTDAIFASDDWQEGRKAFAEKRAPDYKGR